MRAVLIVTAVLTLARGDSLQDGRGVADEDPRVRVALDVVRANEPATIADQVRLCEIPAPPFGERARAGVMRDLLAAAGLKNVRLDSEGNVVGDRPGRAARPHLVLAAHLDTVFPDGHR